MKAAGKPWPKKGYIENIAKWLSEHFAEPIDELGLSAKFLAREFEWRREMAIDDAVYLERSRRRRKHALNRTKREAINSLYQRYLEFKQENDLADWETIQHEALSGITAANAYYYRYDVVLLDEAQDFAPSWIDVVRTVLKPDGHLFLCEDPSQSIFRSYTWPERRLTIKKGRSEKLTIPLRSTYEIGKAAFSLIGLERDFAEDQEHPDLTTEMLRHGPHPRLILFDDEVAEQSFIADELAIHLLTVNGEKITIIVDGNTAQWRLKGDNAKTVEVSSFRTMKGLEYMTVYIPSLNRHFDTIGDDDEERLVRKHEIFTAMMRARHQLTLTTTGTLPTELSALIPHCEYIDARTSFR